MTVGEKDAVAPVGNPDAVNDTGLAVVVPAGITIMLKFAGWPAVTVVAAVCTFKLKSPTTNVSAEVVPPPGAGLFTVTLSVPLWAKSVAGRIALSEVGLTRVVARVLPPTRTTELALKFVPVTFRVSTVLPASTLEGERLLAPGTGLFMVNVTINEGEAPGFLTVTNGVPAAAMALAGIAACNCVALTNADETTLELKVTTELAVKPFPVSVSVNAGPPAVVLAGTKPPTTGWVFTGRIVRGNVAEVPPLPMPPTGFDTEILMVP